MEKHSEHFFNDSRDFWWNKDFLDLMAKRWQLENVHAALDVGCGVGHWTKELLRILPASSTVSAVDREPDWVRRSSERFQSRVSVQVSRAEDLPFENETFDLVSCQTLLIHVADPRLVIREMLRVLKPGGLLAVAEPSNMAQTGSSVETSVNEAMALHQLELFCQRGKIALGEGHDSIGDLLPGIFASLGLKDIEVYLSDRATSVFPPYSLPGQKEMIADTIDFAEKQYPLYGYEQTRRYFLAAGGTTEAFKDLWAVALRQLEKTKNSMLDGTFHCGGGHVTYLVSGRKGLN